MRTNAAVQAADRLHVVIEDVRAGIQHARYGVQIAAKIGSQYFNASAWKRVANFTHRFGKMPRAAVGKIVAIDGGDHHIAQFPAGGHARDVGRLVGIQREFLLVWGAFGNGTESTAARAQIAEDHESRRAAAEAFVKIGAARGFADRVQIQAANFGLQSMYCWKVRGAFAQPFRQTRLRWPRLKLDQL